MTIKLKYPGISDDLIRNIMVDDNPQRKAEVFATLDEAFKMMEKGKGEDEIIKIFKDTSRTKQASGGRAEFIFGGSAGLKAMWKQMLKNLSKGKDKPVKRLFPTLSAEERAMEKVVMGTPEQKAFREGEAAYKLEGIDLLINRMKHDKKIIERQAKNKAIGDPGLDFLMKKLEENMSQAYSPHLKKYTNIDKDILQMENIKKNLIMKDRKLNAEGGRVSYSGGGSAGLPAITYGTPHMNMQGPQMPAGPQPAGIPGGTIVAKNQMQQAPWMGPQMQQGIGGMPRPQPGGMPRPMAAEGGRIGFGLGGMFGKRIEWDNLTETQKKWLRDNQHLHKMPIPKAEGKAEGGRIGFKFGGIDKGRRAFMKWLAGITGAGIAAGSGILKFGKAAKVATVAPKATEAVVALEKAAGMPYWLSPLVNKVIKQGDDVTAKLAVKERQTVHHANLDDIEDVTVYRDLDSGNVHVEYGPRTFDENGKIVRASNDTQTVHLDYKAGEVIEEGKMKGKKTKPEFSASEPEPEVANWDGDIEMSGINEVNKVDDLVTPTSKLQEFATDKKLNIRDRLKLERQQKYRNKLDTDTMEQIEYIENKHGGMSIQDYVKEGAERGDLYRGADVEGIGYNLPKKTKKASGGLAHLLGE